MDLALHEGTGLLCAGGFRLSSASCTRLHPPAHVIPCCTLLMMRCASFRAPPPRDTVPRNAIRSFAVCDSSFIVAAIAASMVQVGGAADGVYWDPKSMSSLLATPAYEAAVSCDARSVGGVVGGGGQKGGACAVARFPRAAGRRTPCSATRAHACARIRCCAPPPPPPILHAPPPPTLPRPSARPPPRCPPPPVHPVCTPVCLKRACMPACLHGCMQVRLYSALLSYAPPAPKAGSSVSLADGCEGWQSGFHRDGTCAMAIQWDTAFQVGPPPRMQPHAAMQSHACGHACSHACSRGDPVGHGLPGGPPAMHAAAVQPCSHA